MGLKNYIPLIILAVSFGVALGVAYNYGLTKEHILIAFLVSNGISLILGGLSHILVPNIVASGIGWKTCPPFQYEVGIANIILGILCLGTIHFRDSWILSTIVATSLWGFGNAIGHIMSLVNDGNRSPGNTGWALYLDIFLPITSIILYCIYKYT